ncbi:MAG TPA: LuxR family transcriptional regulator, partial [Spirochaetia bacterium]|nr:LuxR family transcriptional regulator [Spirochaetia bacterium]
HLELLYYFLAFVMGFASLIFTVTAYRKTGEDLYKYLLLFLSSLTFVVFTKTMLFYVVINMQYGLTTLYILQFLNVTGHCSLIYTIPKFVHAFERFPGRTVVDGVFGGVAALLGSGYFLLWGDPRSEYVVSAAFGLIPLIMFYSLIVVLVRWKKGKKRGNRPFQTFLLVNILIAIVLFPGFNIFSDLFIERFPFIENLVLSDFYTFPAFYFILNLLTVILVRKELLRAAPALPDHRVSDDLCRSYEISPREREVMDLLLQGYRYKDIGEKLFISVATVKTHILHIYTKLDVFNKGEFLKKIREHPHL